MNLPLTSQVFYNALAELCVTRTRYLEIPVNTAQSADFQSCDWRPVLRTDNSSVSHFDIPTKPGTVPMENKLQDQWNYSLLGKAVHVNILFIAVISGIQAQHITIIYGIKKMQIEGGGIWILSTAGALLMMLEGTRPNSDEQWCWKNDFIFYRELLGLIICSLLVFILYVSIGCIIGRRKTRSSLQTKTFVIMFSHGFGRLFSHVT